MFVNYHYPKGIGVFTNLIFYKEFVKEENQEYVYFLMESIRTLLLYKAERKTHPSECGWDVSDKKYIK